MKEAAPYVISVSRMLGSGGIFIGKQLSEKLNIAYFDKEILFRAAKEFGVSETDLQDHDEKPTPLWELFLKSGVLDNPDIYMAPKLNLPSDLQLFEAEGEIIKSIANERSAVVVGRGGSYILRDHPRHISVFLYCDAELRKLRIQELFHITEKDAKKMITSSDSKRGHHYQVFTGNVWTDARQYNICIDTGKISLDDSVELILKYAERKFGVA